MRIAIDARYLSSEFSGIGNYSENLLKRLVPSDPENHYSIFVHESYNRELNLPENAEIIPSPTRPVSIYTLFGFRRAVRETQADILHSFFPITPVSPRIPTVVTVHDLQALLVPEFTARRFFLLKKSYDLFYQWAYPRSIRQAKWLVADSHATKRDMARLFPDTRSNTIVVYGGLEESFGAPPDEATLTDVGKKYNLPKRYVLYIGSTRPNKNLPNMIEAFNQMREQHEDARDVYFVMVVSADRFFEDCRKLIKKLRIQKRMRVYTQISEIEKRCFYARASALFLATKNEGFGIPLLEAQACGVPVLAADHASLPEIANGTALLTDPDDPEDMAKRLHQIISDETLRGNLIAAGRKNVERFRWENAARALRDMYHYLF